MKQTLTATLFVFALLFAACGSTGSTDAADNVDGQEPETSESNNNTESPDNKSATRLWILPETVECQGEAPQTCLQVAESEDGEYEYFYDQIDGFTYEEGTRYVLDVEVSDVNNPPADGSSVAYRLIEIVEQTKS